ncbi:hypothetical protein QQP08_021635, partial [Theobroma cacao]
MTEGLFGVHWIKLVVNLGENQGHDCVGANHAHTTCCTLARSRKGTAIAITFNWQSDLKTSLASFLIQDPSEKVSIRRVDGNGSGRKGKICVRDGELVCEGWGCWSGFFVEDSEAVTEREGGKANGSGSRRQGMGNFWLGEGSCWRFFYIKEFSIGAGRGSHECPLFSLRPQRDFLLSRGFKGSGEEEGWRSMMDVVGCIRGRSICCG